MRPLESMMKKGKIVIGVKADYKLGLQKRER